MLLIFDLCARFFTGPNGTGVGGERRKIKIAILSFENSTDSALRSCWPLFAVSAPANHQLLMMALECRTCFLILRMVLVLEFREEASALQYLRS